MWMKSSIPTMHWASPIHFDVRKEGARTDADFRHEGLLLPAIPLRRSAQAFYQRRRWTAASKWLALETSGQVRRTLKIRR